jgi:hypothetical protein
MKHFKNITVAVLAILIPACGQQLVQFGDEQGDAGAANGGHIAGSGNGGNGHAGDEVGGDEVGGDENGGSGVMGGVGVGAAAGMSGEDGMAGVGGESAALLQVVSTNPADRDVQVAINKTIAATFNELMNPATVPAGFTVTDPGGTPVSGQVAVSGDVATFAPTDDLSPDTTFTATISIQATALSGDALADEYVWTFKTGTQAAQPIPQLVVPLGAASNFAILASAAITNIPTSDIFGDVGLTPDPGSNISGFSMPATCPEVTGFVYVVDASGPACTVVDPVLLANAKASAELAFTNAKAAARGTPQAVSGNLNGLTLYPGLYESGSSLQLSAGGFLYLDAQGDEDAVFIIRSATSITTEDGSEVVLTKGAQAANIYWTAGSAVTLGTNSIMKGTLIAGTAISLLTGSDLEGRALNQGSAAAAITLDASTITIPDL